MNSSCTPNSAYRNDNLFCWAKNKKNSQAEFLLKQMLLGFENTLQSYMRSSTFYYGYLLDDSKFTRFHFPCTFD